MPSRARLSLAFLVCALTLLLPASTGAQGQTLNATVGPGFAITLTNADGSRVRNLAAGTYTIRVDDRSDFHNFHLQGAGVDQSTEVEFVGQRTWTVTLSNGTYRFQCDPHATQMRGSFTVGAAGQAPSAQQPTRGAAVTRLNGAVGPGFTISLRSAAGARVSSLGAGRYRIVVRDRSSMHNFHLRGPGVNRRTGIAFRGTATWTVRLRAGGRYRFWCDPHATQMRGSFRVRAAGAYAHHG